MREVAFMVKVSIGYSWNRPDASSWHFGSYEEAKKYCEERAENGEVDWYSIENCHFIPCDSNNPGGKLYIGVDGYEFVEVKRGEE